MKRIISNVMLVAAAAMAFFACQKQEINAPEEVKNVTLSFSSEKPSFDDETKTQWNGSSIVWSTGDKISVAYTVADKWMGYMPKDGETASAPKLYKSDPLEASSTTAKFNVSGNFNIEAEGTHVFYGVYPAISSTLFDDAPVATVTIPSLQTPEASSFDSSADLMTGISVGEFSSLPKPEDEISMMWTRRVAHADITLKSVNGIAADEKIFSITLTAQDDANLVGKQKVNLLKNDEVNKAVASAKTNEVKLNGGNLSIDANRNIEFWACILPATLTSLKVEVDTDKATYTREIKNISKTFIQNARNTLSIKMDGATRVEKAAETWRLVKSSETLSEGTYVLVVKNTNTNNYTGALDSSNGSSSSPALNTSVKVNGDVLESVDPKVQFDLEIVNEGYKFAVAGQTTNYLYTTSSNSGVRIGTNTNNVWTLSKDADHPDAYTFKCNATARYLGVYEANAEWRCYTSINDNIKDRNSEVYLYKKTSGAVAPDTTPKLELGTAEIELTSGGGDGTVAVTAVNVSSPQVRALAEAESEDEVAWLSVEYDENGTLSYAAEANGSENSREAYIEIYAEDLEGNPLTRYIHVTQDGKSAGGDTTPKFVKVTSAPTDWSGVYILGYTNESTLKTLCGKNSGGDYGAYVNLTLEDQSILSSEVPNECVLTIESTTNGYSLNVSNTYLGYTSSATSSNNYLWFNSSFESKKYEWTIKMDGENVLITNVYNTGRVIKWNNASNGLRFACYTSDQSPIQLYKLMGGESGGETPEPEEPETPVQPTKLSTPVVKCSDSDITENSLKFTWGAVENASKYVVTFNNGTSTETPDTYYEATGLNANTKYSISVKAVGDGVNYTESDAGTAEGTTKAEQQSGGDEKVPSTKACYTLSTASQQGSNNSYNGNCDITVNSIKWNVTGNTKINPWRIGGKSLTKVNRTVYSKTAYSSALSKVEFVAGSKTATWHSLTLEYSTNSSFSDAKSIVVTSVAANETIPFSPDGGFPENCYFRFTLNVSAGGSNQYVELKEIKFYGYVN